MSMYYMWLLTKMLYARVVINIAQRLHVTACKLQLHSNRIVKSVSDIVNP